MSKLNKPIVLIMLSLASLLFATGPAFAAVWFQTNQLTDNAIADEGPQVGGDNVAWHGSKARIYIDGKYVTTVDAYASDVRYRKAIFAKTWPPGSTPSRSSMSVIRSVLMSMG